jgi:group I intron endonuclease
MIAIICIYKITSLTNGKCYIGSAINFNRRKIRHNHFLRHNNHDNILLQNHCNKYGIHDFIFDIVEVVDDVNNLISREQFYIDTLKPEFNICQVAGNCLGKKHSEATKLKMSLAKIGKKPNNFGKKRSEHAIKAASDSKRGQKDDEQTRKNKSAAQYARIPSRGYKRKPFTDEHRLNLSNALKGRIAWNKGTSKINTSC